MNLRWLLGLLALGPPMAAAQPIPADPWPLSSVAAILPENPRLPPDRPTELPNIDPRDLRPIRPPTDLPEPRSQPTGPKSDYDPSYLYLPERNPGRRQPPCPCLPLGRTWIDATYFLGKMMDDRVPALATSGGTGVEGATGVSVLHGNERVDRPFRSGIRVDVGHWFDKCQNWGIDSSFFYMESSRSNFEVASNGSPLLARPFIAEPGAIASALILASEGQTGGSMFVTSPVAFLGADVNSRHTLFCEDRVRLDFLVGYRFIRMKESLTIQSHSEGTATNLLGIVQDIRDHFETLNLFNGAQVGITGEFRWQRFYVAGAGKAAIGINWHRLDIDGSTRSQQNGVSTTTSTGFLARTSNIGRTRDTHFAVVPEANLTLGYLLGEHWRTFLGYTFVYNSSVARPGPSIDTRIGTSTSGITYPLRLDPNSDFWMHGINLGLEARY